MPLRLSSLLPNIRHFIAERHVSDAPILSEHQVISHIRRANKPLGIVPGDLPKKVVNKCIPQIATPAKIIFNKITQNAIYPTAWKVEHQIAIPKVHPPRSEDDLRNIAKTPFLSKVYESFLAEWLIKIIKPYLDPNQCGMKGS